MSVVWLPLPRRQAAPLPRAWSTLTTAPECKVGVVIEVNAETDFVAKNDKFVAFVKEATQVIMKQNPADVEALMACKTENGETVDEALKNLILVIKENIKVRRFVRYEGVCSAYVHGGGTHGILVNFETTNGIEAKDEFAAYGKDVAMQVAAAQPRLCGRGICPRRGRGQGEGDPAGSDGWRSQDRQQA